VSIHTLLLVLALIFCLISAAWEPAPPAPRVRLFPLGMALFVAAFLFP